MSRPKQSKSEWVTSRMSAKRIVGKRRWQGSRGGQIKGKEEWSPPWGFNGLAQQLRVLVGGLGMDRSILFSGNKTFELLRKTVWRMKENMEDTKGRRVSQRKTRCNKVEKGPKRENRQGGGVIGIILVMQFNHAEWRGWRTRRVCHTGAREDLHERMILEVKITAWTNPYHADTPLPGHTEKLYIVLQSLYIHAGVSIQWFHIVTYRIHMNRDF